jgi:DNA-binding HxlR family transcriptional regulator
MEQLDPLLHAQLRLAIVSILMGLEEAHFGYLKEKTQTTAGNLSVQLGKLRDAGYVSIRKGYRDNYPLTTVRMTDKGRSAFEAYVVAMKRYLQL